MQDNNMDHRNADDLQQDLADGRVLDWAEMYALDAVSEEERSTIEDYVSVARPELRDGFHDRVRAARETIAQAYAVDDVEPPAALLERILGQLPVEVGAGAASASPVAAGSEDGHAVDELGTRRAAKQRGTSPVGRWLVAAAAAVVLAVGGVSIAQNLQQTSVEQEILQARDLESGTFTMPAGGTAELKLSRVENAAVVTLRDIPAPPAGKVYQMWGLPSDGSDPESIGTMTGDDVADTKVTTVEGIEAFSGVGITVEPDGGSRVPTMPLVAQIPFEA